MPKYRVGPRLYLRPLEEADVRTMYEGMNDPEVLQYLMSPLPISFTKEQEWLTNLNKLRNVLVLAIVLHEGDRHIGNIGLNNIKHIDRNAVTGTVIWDKESWGEGLATEAKMLLLEIGFMHLNLRSIMSRVIAPNAASLRYAHKCGYVEVARIPEWIFRNGQWHDEVLLIVTKERWEPLWQQFVSQQKSTV